MALPLAHGDVDAGWLERALHRGGVFPGAAIRAVASETIGAGFGFDCAVARIAIEGRDAAPTVVAKWCTAANAEKESRFAREVAPLLGVAVPRAFFAETDADRGLLLLEDVNPATQGDVLLGASPAQATSLVDAMAGFHAQFWRRTDEDAVAWLRRWTRDLEDLVRRTREGVPRFLEIWGERLSLAARAAVAASPERLASAYAALDGSPPTLVHADLHLDNVLFRADGTPVVLDWSDAARGPAEVDLGRLLYDGLRMSDPSAATRRSLLTRYVGGLRDRGVHEAGVDALLVNLGHFAVVAIAAEVRAAARGYEELPKVPRVPRVLEIEVLCYAEAAASP